MITVIETPAAQGLRGLKGDKGDKGDTGDVPDLPSGTPTNEAIAAGNTVQAALWKLQGQANAKLEYKYIGTWDDMPAGTVVGQRARATDIDEDVMWDGSAWYVDDSQLPVSVLQSSGAPTFSGSAITVKAQTIVCGSGIRPIAQQVMTTDLPGAAVFSVAAGVPTYTANPVHLAKPALTVTNASGGSVSGNITITGNDERGYQLTTVVASGTVLNATSATVYPVHYLATITSVSVSGTLGNAGVSIAAVEYQYRGHVKVSTDGALAFAWDNTYADGELLLLTYEARAAGVISIKDWRTLSAIHPAQRIGSEVVNWSGGTPQGPQSWLGSCIYAACELMDGNVLIAGNAAMAAIWDKQVWGTSFVPTGLAATNHIWAVLNMGLDASGAEIIYFGTAAASAGVQPLLIRWNRTANTYSSVTLSGWTNGKAITSMYKLYDAHVFAVTGEAGNINLIVDGTPSNGVPSVAASNLKSPVGWTDDILSSAYYDEVMYISGGAVTGIKFGLMQMKNQSIWTFTDLSAYLPGKTSAKSGSGSKIIGLAASPNGKLLLVGVGPSGYIAEWDCNQAFATVELSITASGTTTVPAGTRYSNGTVTYRTKYNASISGAGTIYVLAVAEVSGMGGCSAVSTITTITDAVANVTAVTNTTPAGMGRLIANAGSEAMPKLLVSDTALAAGWYGKGWVIAMQGGNVLTFDGARLQDITPRFEFKGRATGVLPAKGCTWIYGDEGKLFSMPN